MEENNSYYCERFSLENLLLFLHLFTGAICVLTFLLPVNGSCAPEITFRNNLIGFDTMLPGEILSNNSDAQSIDEGSFSPESSWYGNIAEEGLAPGDLQTVYAQLTFSRWTNESGSNRKWLWRYRQRKNEHPSQPSFSVSYSIEDPFGNSNRLTHSSDNASWLEATVIDEKIINDSNNRRWIFKGSARIEFNISNAHRSGNYYGVIYTTLTYL